MYLVLQVFSEPRTRSGPQRPAFSLQILAAKNFTVPEETVFHTFFWNPELVRGHLSLQVLAAKNFTVPEEIAFHTFFWNPELVRGHLSLQVLAAKNFAVPEEIAFHTFFLEPRTRSGPPFTSSFGREELHGSYNGINLHTHRSSICR